MLVPLQHRGTRLNVREVDVLPLADGEIRLNGIYLRDRRENRRRIDKIADLHLSNSGDAIDQRFHLRELEVQLGLLHLGLGGLDRGFRRAVRLYVVVELALRYGAFFGQRSVPINVHCSLGELCLSLCQLGVRLFEHSLKGTRVNLKKNLTLADKRAFFVALPDDVSRHLRLDLRVYVAIERRNPFAEDWNVLLNYAGNFHLRNWNNRCCNRLTATHCERYRHQQESQNEPRCCAARKAVNAFWTMTVWHLHFRGAPAVPRD